MTVGKWALSLETPAQNHNASCTALAPAIQLPAKTMQVLISVETLDLDAAEMSEEFDGELMLLFVKVHSPKILVFSSSRTIEKSCGKGVDRTARGRRSNPSTLISLLLK